MKEITVKTKEGATYTQGRKNKLEAVKAMLAALADENVVSVEIDGKAYRRGFPVMVEWFDDGNYLIHLSRRTFMNRLMKATEGDGRHGDVRSRFSKGKTAKAVCGDTMFCQSRKLPWWVD